MLYSLMRCQHQENRCGNKDRFASESEGNGIGCFLLSLIVSLVRSQLYSSGDRAERSLEIAPNVP